MRNFDFSSKKSRIYTNLRNNGHIALAPIPWKDPETIERTMFRQFSIEASMSPLDIRTVFLSSQDELKEVLETHAYAGCRVLTVVINAEDFINTWNRASIESLMKDVALTRKERTETTIIVLSGGVIPLASELFVMTGVDEYFDMKINVSGGPEPYMVVSENGTAVEVVQRLVDAFGYEREIDVSGYKHVGFLDIDETLLCGRTFMRTGWGGTHTDAFLKDPADSIRKFDQDALCFLKKLSATAGVKWVLSSQWRISFTDEEVKHFGRYLGIPLIDKVMHGGRRPEEIMEWMSRHKVEGEAFSLDNEFIDVPGVKMIHVDYRNGVSWNNCRDMSDLLGFDIYDIIHSRAQYNLLPRTPITVTL